VLTIQVVGSALAYGTQILLARWMGPLEFGIFVYAWSWVTLLPILAALGLGKSVIRLVPEYLARGDWGRLSGVIRRSSQTVLLAGLAVTACAYATLLVVLKGHVAGYYVAPLSIGFAAIPLLGLLLLYSGLARGFGWAGLAYAPRLVIQPGLFVIALFLLVLFAVPLTSRAALALAAIACLITALGQWIVFRRNLPAEVRRARPAYDSRQWMRIALPVLLVDSIVLVLWQVDVVMLGSIRTPQEVALYNASLKTAGLVIFFFTALSALAGPRFAMLYASGDRQQLQNFVSGVARWIFWPSLLVVLGVLACGKMILGVFGASFVAAYSTLAVLSVGFLFYAATGPTSEYLIGSGNQDAIVLANACAAGANVALNAVLIPLWGTLGAAVASLISLGILSVWLYAVVRRRLGLNALFLGSG